jgi:hypothetical protein
MWHCNRGSSGHDIRVSLWFTTFQLLCVWPPQLSLFHYLPHPGTISIVCVTCNKFLQNTFLLRFNCYVNNNRKSSSLLSNSDHTILCSPHHTIRMIKSRTMKWTGRVAHMGEMRNVYIILRGCREGKMSLWRPRRRWRIILKWILRKQISRVWTWFIWLRIGFSSGVSWAWICTFGFLKRRGIPSLFERLLASEEGT